MTDETKKYLSDILQAIEHIESFMESISDFDNYLEDIKTQSAVERQIGIIGEVVKILKRMNPSYGLEHWKEIIGFRNRIIHDYSGIDETIVWAIIHLHLPVLKVEVMDALKNNN